MDASIIPDRQYNYYWYYTHASLRDDFNELCRVLNIPVRLITDESGELGFTNPWGTFPWTKETMSLAELVSYRGD